MIDFVEKERDGPMIPLNLTTPGLVAMLGISEHSMSSLKAEMKRLLEMKQSDQRNITKNRELRARLTSTYSSTSRSPLVSRSHRNRKFTTVSIGQTSLFSVPTPMPPNRISNSHRPRTYLTEEVDEVRFTFHLLLAERMYPTTELLISRLLSLHLNFPIVSRTSLWRYVKKTGFLYKTANKVKVPLDDIKFVAQRAFFFQKIDELRRNNTKIFFHAETWTNDGQSVWITNEGIGRLKKTEGKRNCFS